MPLCTPCNTIPFRRIISGDASLPVSKAKGTLSESYHHKSHPSIARLIASSSSCRLCHTIARALQGSFWYQNMMQDGDKTRQVWLCLPVGSWAPVLWIYLGGEMPETKVFGRDAVVYVDLDDPMAEFIGFRHVHEKPTHDQALRQIDLWVDECLHGHAQCSRVARSEMKLPTRVLDLEALPVREEMIADREWHELFGDAKCKLVENYAQEYGHYVALSYCWGRTLAYKTTKNNRESHMRGFGFARLPRSLQDAIFVSRYLGLRYIWIDCLCIVQDDKADWQREAASMGNVYSNAYLTISAARGENSQAGFLGPRKVKAMDPISFQDDKGQFQLYFYAYDVSAMPGSIESASLDPLRNEPLSSRVWTLQERLLPSRTLHFATDQMYWECAKVARCEDGEGFGSAELDFNLNGIVEGLQASSESDSFRRHWYQLIRAYTSRNMTYQSDKFPALSGIVAQIQRQTNDSYYAGLWKNHFLEGLLWRPENPDLDIFASVKTRPTKPDKWRAPSWSFAAVEGVIRYQEIGNFGTDYCAELKECRVRASGENPLGELKAGFARITGPITVMEKIGQECTSEGIECAVLLRDGTRVAAKVFFDFERPTSRAVLMLSPHAGLAIAPLDAAHSCYLRTGVVQVLKYVDSPPFAASQYPEPDCVTLF